jgi:hypothetical protein
MMKEIIYRGGLVRFHVPSSWVEEYQPEGGGTFYEDRDDSGTLRLNVLTFASKEPVTSNGIPQLFKEMSLTHNSIDLRALPNGNVLLKYADRAVEEGEELLIYYWQLGNPVPPKHLRIADFSFTILASQSSDTEIIEQVRMLDGEIAGAEFAPRLRL